VTLSLRPKLANPEAEAPALDRRTAEPLYRQVTRAIAEEIGSGELTAGQQLPSERELTERFRVSRVTARRALRDLVEDGLVESAAGKGWFVASGPVSEPPNKLLSFSAMARSRGLTATSRVLESTVRPATLDEADKLGIVPGADVLAIRRLRFLDGLPVAIDYSQIPISRAPIVAETNFEMASLYDTLRGAGIFPTSADYVVEATPASAEEAKMLGVEVGAPILLCAQLTYDHTGRPIETGAIRYRGDRYRFRARLTS
jgi:GntR family transcriptional regulator